MAKFWDGLQQATTVKNEDKILIGSASDSKTRYADVSAVTASVTARMNELDNRKADSRYLSISTKEELFLFQKPGLYGVDISIDANNLVGGWASMYVAPVGDDGSDVLQVISNNGKFYSRVIPQTDRYMAQNDHDWISATAEILAKMANDKNEINARLNQKASSTYYLISSKEDIFLLQNPGLYGVEIYITGGGTLNGEGSMFVSLYGDNGAQIMQTICKGGCFYQRVIPQSSVYQAQYDSEWTEMNQGSDTPVQPNCFALEYAENGKSYGQFSSFCFGEDEHIYIALGNYTGSQGGIAKIDKNMNLVKMNASAACIEIAYCYGKVFALDPSSRVLMIFNPELERIASFNIGVVDGQKMFRVIGGELYYLSKLANEWNLQKIDAQGARTTILNYGATQPSDFRELYGSIYVCLKNKIEVYNLNWEKQADILNIGVTADPMPLLGFENCTIDCIFPVAIPDALIAFTGSNLLRISDNAVTVNVSIADKLGYTAVYKDRILYGAIITNYQYLLLTNSGFMIYAALHPSGGSLAGVNYTSICPIGTLKHCLMKDGFLYYSYGRKLIKHQIA